MSGVKPQRLLPAVHACVTVPVWLWSCAQHFAQCELLPRDGGCSPDASIAVQFRQHVESKELAPV